ncbi:DUF6066 family protein [Hyalangium rubrum]|uniref:DUF6066 family protein n=1 Tax=Hyalangium rubrum TaxID=3103134 RepID=A0ABU5H474_9BACT|nr:DUF6066 family protein [Hyalangium sp. s54d21]MDY7228275.1 DUF6066 family protein [Hyalangium sp. s54d21]
MNRLLVTLALLLPALASADVDPRFARLRDAAEPLGGLNAFLSRYIGECGDVFASADCRTKADAFRKNYKGKKLYMIVDEAVVNQVSPGPYQPTTGDYVINILPFFSGGSYALTHGTPKKTNAAGNPILPLLSVTGRAPTDWTGPYFTRLFSNQGVRVQVVFTPLDIWSLAKPKGGKTFGVSARIEAILLTEGRTGQELGLWLDGKDANTRKKK